MKRIYKSLDVDVDKIDGECEGFVHGVAVQVGREREVIRSGVAAAVHVSHLVLLNLIFLGIDNFGDKFGIWFEVINLMQKVYRSNERLLRNEFNAYTIDIYYKIDVPSFLFLSEAPRCNPFSIAALSL